MERIQIRWDDEGQSIICCEFAARWTLDEFYAAYSQTEHMIRNAPNQVIGIIVDDSNNTTPPSGSLTAFQHIFKRGSLPMAIIGGHQLTKLLLKTAKQSLPSKRIIFPVADFDEARDVLKQNKENLID